MVVWYIVIFMFQLLFKAFGDWWYKKYKKKIINHKASVGIDGLIYFITGYFFIIVPKGWTTVWFAIGVLVVTASIRWILYDLLYNWINKHRWSHCGDSAWLDEKTDLIDGKDDNICAWSLVVKLIVLVIGINLIILG